MFSGLLLLAVVSAAQTAPIANGYIYTAAGDGVFGSAGDGGPATKAELSWPYSLTFDASENLYIADLLNNRVRKVDYATGTMTTYAGNGVQGFGGDGGPATAAEMYWPYGVASDPAGNLYIADSGNGRVRKVDFATGIITTVAGNGATGDGPDGGLAVNTALTLPVAVALDSAGNLYITDNFDGRIRKVDASTGVITTVAGNGAMGYNGNGIQATSAKLNSPVGIALDGEGNLYIADRLNSRIRRVDAATGIISTVAGNGTAGYSGDGGAATSAELSLPSEISLDASGNFYILDSANSRVRVVDAATGIMTTIAGDGITGYNGDGIPALQAEISFPQSLALDFAGNFYIADTGNSRVRIVRPQVVSTTTTTLTASANPAPYGSMVTFTATVSGSESVPSGGSVSFYDGKTYLGSASLADASASYATHSLSLGPHAISAVYAGAVGFDASTSNTVVEVIFPIDFGISAAPATRTVYTGEAATYTVTIAPGTGFNIPVDLSCSALPAHTTCTFSPATVAGGSWSSTVVVQTSAPSPLPSAAAVHGGWRVTAVAGALLLFLRRKRWPALMAVVVLLVAGGAINGCGAAGPLVGGTPVGAQTVTITGVANNGLETLTHSTHVTVQVNSLF